MKSLKNIKDLPNELKKPIEVENILQKTSVLREGSTDAYQKKIQELLNQQEEYTKKEIQRKFDILANHLNVDLKSEDGWKNLAETMAMLYFEGFTVRVKISKGPKKKWDSYTLFRLYYEVYIKNKETGHSVSRICGWLSKRSPWQTVLKTSDVKKAKESLNKQYQKALSDPFVSFFKKIIETGSQPAQDQVQKIYELICSGELTPLQRQ